MELRHKQSQYYIKVVRSPDGESKGFPIGQMSVQRAAAWVLDIYYTEFPIYNPYLDRITANRQRKGSKMYDMDGSSTGNNVRPRPTFTSWAFIS
jgi:vang-like